MPASLPPWPALAAGSPDGSLEVHRAVLGKVHQAASDFRWITHTEAIRPRKLGLDQKLSFGPEDRPVRSPAWRALDDALVAIVSYRSRAVDRAGRAGGLEKQILYWPKPRPEQTVAGAFALLGALGEASDAVWWDHWEDYRWDEPEFFLPREPEEIPFGRLDLAVSQGLTELTAACSEDALAEFYAGLLAVSQGHPAALEGLAEPLPPLALAALLLPFAPEEARQLSLAGALPNSRHLAANLANWRGVARTQEQPELPDDGPQPTAAQQQRGAAMAAAVFRGDPAGLAGVAPAVPPEPVEPPAAPPKPAPKPEPPPASLPAQATAAPVLSRAGERFEQFLRAGAESRSLEAIPGNAAVLSEQEGRYLLERAQEAIASLESETEGDSPRERQLRAKIELIRSWLVSCFPRPETETALGSAQNQKIPPLLFALTLEPNEWAASCRLSRSEFGELVRVCGRLKQGFTRSQLEAFGEWGRKRPIRSLLRS